MTSNATELQQALQERGLMKLVAAAPIGTAAEPHDRPFAIALLLGGCGWLAGLFLLGFFALLLRPQSTEWLALYGGLLLAAAWGLFRLDRDGREIFVAQLALTLSIAGQCLMLGALVQHTRDEASVAATLLLLQTVLVALMPNRLHRALSYLFAVIAWALLLRFALFDEGWRGQRGAVFHEGFSWAALLAWFLAWLPVIIGLGWLIRNEHRWMARGWQAVARPVTSGLVIGLAFVTVASQPFASMAALAAHGWASALWPLLSAVAALVALAAAFALRRHGLMVLCVLAALLHLAHFSYVLGTSLLVKSITMLALGVVLLFVSRALRSKEPA